MQTLIEATFLRIKKARKALFYVLKKLSII